MGMMSVRRRVLEIMASSGGNNYVEGTFTAAAKVKSVTVEHNLGRVPRFAIFYPIDVSTSDTSSDSWYLAIFGIIMFDGLGQSNYNIYESGTQWNKPIALRIMTYPNNINNRYPASDTSLSNPNYMGYADATNVVFGGTNETSASGWIAAGTYGYIVG